MNPLFATPELFVLAPETSPLRCNASRQRHLARLRQAALFAGSLGGTLLIATLVGLLIL